MQNKDRAKIFMPFDALKGFSEVIKLMEKNAESKKTFSEDMEIDLNNKITNAYIIWNNDLYQVPTNKNIQPLKININDTAHDFYKLFKDNNSKRRK